LKNNNNNKEKKNLTKRLLV